MKPSFKDFLADGVTYMSDEAARKDDYIARQTKHVSGETTKMMDKFTQKVNLQKKLKQAREELHHLRATPFTQDIADAIDDARDEVARLEAKIAGLEESVDNQSADATFKFRCDQAERLIHGLIGKIQETKIRQQSNPRDWGYAGSMAHVVETLEELDQFLGGN